MAQLPSTPMAPSTISAPVISTATTTGQGGSVYTTNPVWSAGYTTTTVPSGYYQGLTGNLLQNGANGVTGASWTSAIGSTAGYQASTPNPMVLSDNKSQEICRIEPDGKVIWANGIDVDEAAEAFSRSISIGTERKAGITERVKCEIRNAIFEEIIAIAKEKGSLTSDDLTLMLEATKIMEKLKGIK